MKSLPASHSPQLSGSIERLEPRCCPSTLVIGAGHTVLIVGDSAANAVSIIDDGAGNITTDTDGTSTAFTGITRIVVKTQGGDDTVSYNLRADLTTPRRLEVDLGTGDDFAVFGLGYTAGDVRGGPILNTIADPLHVNLRGGLGDDTVLAFFGIVDVAYSNANVQQNVLFNAQLDAGADSLDIVLAGDVKTSDLELNVGAGEGDDSLDLHAAINVGAAGGRLTVNFRGQSGADFIGIDFEGILAGPSSPLLVRADGGIGDDMIVTNFRFSSVPQKAEIPIRVFGGEGDDNLTLNFLAASGSPAGNYQKPWQYLDGGNGFDFVTTNDAGRVRLRHYESVYSD